MTDEQPLKIYTIYWSPIDYPHRYVVRAHLIGPSGSIPEGPCQIADTLGAARRLLPPGLFAIGREPDDDAAIVESWV